MINNRNLYRNSNSPPGAGTTRTEDGVARCINGHKWNVEIIKEMGTCFLSRELCPECGEPGQIESTV